MPSRSSPSRNVLSPSEARALATAHSTVPEVFRRLFGAANVAALSEALTDPDLQTIDTLVMSGQLTDEEAEEYQFLLPELHAVRREMYALADAFAVALQPKLPYYFDQTFTRHDEVNRNGGLARLIGSTFDLATALARLEVHSERNAMVYDFLTRLQGNIMHSFFRHMGRVGTEKTIIEMSEYLRANFDVNAQNGNAYYPPYLSWSCFATHEHFWTKHRAELASFFRHPADTTTRASADPSRNDALFAEVSALSYLRGIETTQRQFGSVTIRIVGEALAQHHSRRGADVCFISLACNAPGVQPKTTPLDLPTKDGGVFQHEEFVDGSEMLTLDRSTGQLHAFGSGLPLDALCDGFPAAAETLRGLVLSILLDDLQGRPDDLVPPSKYPRPAPSISIADEAAVLEDAQAVAAETREELTFAWTPYVAPPTRSADAPRTSTAIEHPRFQMSLLRNRSADEVFRALVRLLGKPTGIEGSHHLFRGRDGRRYPIPFHKGDSVGIGILKKCLQWYGIDPDEFYDALG